MKFRVATASDLPAILEIYNHAIMHTTATFDTEPKSLDFKPSVSCVKSDTNLIVGSTSVFYKQCCEIKE